MNSGAHVLVVGRDQMLMQTRSLILGTYFQVETANRVSEAQSLFAKLKFDLVVLCHSLSDDEYRQVEAMIQRQDPRPKVLSLHVPGKGPMRNGSDYFFSSAEGPYALLKKAADVLAFDMKAKGAGTRADARAAGLRHSNT